jgi:AhpC/TSA antioxidant enzyme
MVSLGIKVMVITFEPPPKEVTPQFAYYSDRDRQLYRYFGMLRAGFWDLWGPRTLLVYLQLLLKGRKMLPSVADLHQRGGDVLIDPVGRVRFHHIGSGPADRPDFERIFKAVGQIQ